MNNVLRIYDTVDPLFYLQIHTHALCDDDNIIEYIEYNRKIISKFSYISHSVFRITNKIYGFRTISRYALCTRKVTYAVSCISATRCVVDEHTFRNEDVQEEAIFIDSWIGQIRR